MEAEGFARGFIIRLRWIAERSTTRGIAFRVPSLFAVRVPPRLPQSHNGLAAPPLRAMADPQYGWSARRPIGNTTDRQHYGSVIQRIGNTTDR